MSPTSEYESDGDAEPPSLRVRDIMRPAVVVGMDATLQEVARVMLERHVPAVLVVNASMQVLGVVTERQLTLDAGYLRLACLRVPRINGRPVTRFDEIDAARIAARTMTVDEVMERRLTFASSDELLGEVVERMLQRAAACAVVRQGDELVGTIDGQALLYQVAGERRFAPLVCQSTAYSDTSGPVRITVGSQPRSLAVLC
jgi:CBS domain-containing protein